MRLPNDVWRPRHPGRRIHHEAHDYMYTSYLRNENVLLGLFSTGCVVMVVMSMSARRHLGVVVLLALRSFDP